MEQLTLKFGEAALTYINWAEFLKRTEETETCEYSLYTDAILEGQIEEGLGPFQIFNTGLDSYIRNPIITLRITYHIPSFYGGLLPGESIHDGEAKAFKHYHGASMNEEITSLLSLSLGIRLKSGTVNRRFLKGSDHKGRPVNYGVAWEKDPVLSNNALGTILPQSLGKHNFNELSLLKDYAFLNPMDSLILVKVSRQYQEAMWIAESDPQLSWLMLVSTIEIAADHWKESNESALDRLEASKPDLLKLLRENGEEEFVEKVAEQLVPYMGSTKKFIDFILNFKPEPPVIRPSEESQIDWSPKGLKKSMQKIYDYRSKALHGGSPFPLPMCMAPGDAEKNSGITVYAIGAAWDIKELPMFLQTFEFIVRKCLHKWWAEMLDKGKNK